MCFPSPGFQPSLITFGGNTQERIRWIKSGSMTAKLLHHLKSLLSLFYNYITRINNKVA